MPSVDVFPSTEMISQSNVVSQVKQPLRTTHDYFHIIHKSVDHLEDLSDGHSAFLLGETVEPS